MLKTPKNGYTAGKTTHFPFSFKTSKYFYSYLIQKGGIERGYREGELFNNPQAFLLLTTGSSSMAMYVEDAET
nr:MAG TPA: hypothetical protein [Caudoviricetes sp.]